MFRRSDAITDFGFAETLEPFNFAIANDRSSRTRDSRVGAPLLHTVGNQVSLQHDWRLRH